MKIYQKRDSFTFGWKQGTGKLAVCACRNLLQRLECEGWWQLPARRRAGNFREKRMLGQWCAAAPTPAPITERLGALNLRLIEKQDRVAWQEKLAAFDYLGAVWVISPRKARGKRHPLPGTLARSARQK